MSDDADRPKWWGAWSLPPGQQGRWEVGPLVILVQRRPWEWRVRWWRDDGAPMDRVRVQVPDESVEDAASSEAAEATDAPPPDDAEEQRFAFGETADPLRLKPVLADRAVVANPRTPFWVLSGAEAQAYLTITTWCAFSVGEPPQSLIGLPVSRPRETWFGASTREGELCYASRTQLLVNPDELEVLPHRAVVPVRLVNRGQDALNVERLRLPVPALPLYQAADGALWTPRVTLVREHAELARFEVESGPPKQAGPAQAIGPARHPASQNRVTHAFNAIFKGW